MITDYTCNMYNVSMNQPTADAIDQSTTEMKNHAGTKN